MGHPLHLVVGGRSQRTPQGKLLLPQLVSLNLCQLFCWHWSKENDGEGRGEGMLNLCQLFCKQEDPPLPNLFHLPFPPQSLPVCPWVDSSSSGLGGLSFVVQNSHQYHTVQAAIWPQDNRTCCHKCLLALSYKRGLPKQAGLECSYPTSYFDLQCKEIEWEKTMIPLITSTGIKYT